MRYCLGGLSAAVLVLACGRGGIWDVDVDGAGAAPSSGVGGGLSSGSASANPSGSGAGNPSGGTPSGSGAGTASAGVGGGNSSTGSATPSGSSGSGMDVCPSFGDLCTVCVAQQCPVDWCECTDNQACLDLFGCFGNCQGDADCNQECMTTHPGGIADVSLVSGCAGTTCASSCTWGNADFDECQECIFEDCADEYNDCLSQAPCTALWQCLNACPQLGLSCQQQCYDAHGGGVGTLEVLLQCTVNDCGAECDN